MPLFCSTLLSHRRLAIALLVTALGITPVQAIAILEFPASADTVRYSTLAFSDSLEAIETTDLPPMIQGLSGYVVRRDVRDRGSEAGGNGRQQEGSSPRRSAHLGVGSSRAWNFAGVTWDVARSGRMSAYLAAGFGTILIGVGAAYHANRDGSGVLLSATAGLAGAHANAGYQIRLVDRAFLTGGVSAGSYFLQHNGVLPFVAFERRF